MKRTLSVFLSILIFALMFTPAFAASKPTDGWYTDSKNVTYYYVNGVAVKGLTAIGKSLYYFDSKGALKKNGWAKIPFSNEGISYYKWIYARENGALKEGWKKYKGYWYYLKPFMLESEGAKINGKVYAFNGDGIMISQKGWQSVVKDNHDGTYTTSWFYMVGNGVASTGWKKLGNNWYYFDGETGVMTEDGVHIVGGVIYFFNASGTLAGSKAGWVKDRGCWYYFNSGRGVFGWQKVNNKWYYFDSENGRMYSNGPSKIYSGSSDKTGRVYFFEESGALTSKKGWVKYSQFVYSLGDVVTFWTYIGDGGTCKTGWLGLKGKWYYIDPDTGEMYQNCGASVTSKGVTKPYFFESSGAMTSRTGWISVSRTESGKTVKDWYYVISDGVCAMGWKTLKGKKYFFDGDGKMLADGIYVVSGGIYYFASGGALDTTKNGAVNSNGYSYLFSNGKALTGWQTVKGKKRYYDPNMGFMYKGGMYEIEGSIYEFDIFGTATKVS